jgi:putative spermidine/putrescine transport system permease protein
MTAETSGPFASAAAPQAALSEARPGRMALRAFGILVAIFAILPFLLIIVIAFGQTVEGAAWRWALVLDQYQRFFVGALWPESASLVYLQRLYFSVYFAAVAAVVAMATAFPFAYLLTRLSKRAQAAWLVFILASLSLSEVFVVMGWDILLSNRSGLPMVLREIGVTDWLIRTGWFDVLRERGLATPRDLRFKTSDFATILTMAYLVWPYAVVLLYAPLSRLDPAMTEAARTMGAGPFTVVRTVVLPLVRLPLIGATLLLFVFLLGVYVTVSVFTAPARQTLAISIYEAVRGSNLNAPFGAAQAVVLLVTAAILIGLNQLIVARAEARR